MVSLQKRVVCFRRGALATALRTPPPPTPHAGTAASAGRRTTRVVMYLRVCVLRATYTYDSVCGVHTYTNQCCVRLYIQ